MSVSDCHLEVVNIANKFIKALSCSMNFMIGFVICDQCEMMAELIIQQGTVKIKLAANIVKDVG